MKDIDEMTYSEANAIEYILMDIDDTLTLEGKLTSSSFTALWKLKESGLKLIPVTGRPAGWCDLIARQWPVEAVIGENGALVFWEETKASGLPVLKTEFHPAAIKNDHPVLIKIKERCFNTIPKLRLAKDQFARLFDIAIDFAEEDPILPLSTAEKIREIAMEEGAIAKISSIHVNIWMGNYNKLNMAETFLKNYYGWQKGKGDEQVLFVGDSPNDEPMFARFPLSCGVANVKKYGDLIKNYPAFVSTKEGGDGFAEIAEKILKLKS